ncbi:MAG: bifunctional diaminohydroxyphosphoribosylaminopyrimidine deaminase/5-amino-6-(5-phosphoribosylamino)uracil reductase RibD [Myxococcales bacterium]|nr:bifunctional diaminohydroxyphosphoribosylaminopyrimidine deaminase/5-amino-6-(5-phosphoribosylamino)uracil reductase RibD [Myxococcales bacterium]
MTVSTPYAGGVEAAASDLLPGQRAHDAAMMRLALAAAESARGATSPNPLVGALIVDESATEPRVLATGFHAAVGRAHAEVDALRRLSEAGGDPRGKTLYVTLEPCNHVGRTGKCTDAILAAGIARVVVGIGDPNPRVAGGGADRLRQAGLSVLVGIEEAACRWQNRGYLRWLRCGRPQLVMKAAISLDGRLAPRAQPGASIGPRWLTGQLARHKAHLLRAGCDAILVGAQTVLADDPALTVRLSDAPRSKQPLRVIFDGSLRTPTTAKVASPGSLILTSDASLRLKPDHASALRDQGVELAAVPSPSSIDVASRRGSPTDIDLHQALRLLGERNILFALCEGGGILHGAFLEAGLYDEVALFVAPLLLGDEGVPLLRHVSVPDVSASSWLASPSVTPLGSDLLIEGELRRGGFSVK